MQYNKNENLSKSLVSIKAEHNAGFGDPPVYPVEAAFLLPGYKGLWLDATSWNREAANYFISRSARNPRDLRNHVQRINHQIQQKNPDGVYGALLDLFIILKDRGRPLRERMLKSARQLLRDEWFETLNQRLDRGITELDAMPLSHSSILSKGCAGSRRLVEKIGDSAALDWDTLQEARSYLEYGQVDQAQSLLETAILQGSLRLDIHKDLLEIYKHARDRSNFLKMHRQLDTTDQSVLRLWRKLAAFFREGE